MYMKTEWVVNLMVVILTSISTTLGCTTKMECFKTLKKGRLQGYTLKTVQNVGYSRCYQECVGRSTCKSFNYGTFNGLCELKSKVPDNSDTISMETGYMNSLVPVAQPTACTQDPCPMLSMCLPLPSGGRACLTECGSAPTVSDANLAIQTETFNVVGTVATHTCNNKYRNVGSLQSTCLSSGHWSTFMCVQECDYEATCNTWTIDNTVDRQWQVISGSTISSSTGATGDHTLSGSGSYIYFEASSPVNPGNIAWLISVTLPAELQVCVDLWYYMWGEGMGSLKLKVRLENGNWDFDHTVASGDQGQQWIKETVTISPRSSKYVIVLEGIRGSTTKSDICLDDISIYSC